MIIKPYMRLTDEKSVVYAAFCLGIRINAVLQNNETLWGGIHNFSNRNASPQSCCVLFCS